MPMEPVDTGSDAPPLRAVRWAVLAAVLPFLLLVWRFEFVCDDAFISFRYARHLAEGAGLRFNPGDHTPVEGYSNLLWVLLLAPFELFGFDVTLAARALGTASSLALIALVTRFAVRTLQLGTVAAIVTALFLGTLPPLVVWSTGGLETALFSLLLMGVVAGLLETPEAPRTRVAATCAALAELTRTDGWVWVGIVLAAAGVVAWLATPDAKRRAALLRAAWITLVVLALTTLAHTGFRFAYHGDVVSNTVRAKGLMQPERGLMYVTGTALAVPSMLVAAALGLAGLVRRQRRVALAAGVAVVLGTTYVALPGGDFMTMGRLLVPLMPALALLLASGLQAGFARGGLRALIALGLAACAIALSLTSAFDVHLVPRSVRERFAFRGNTGVYETEVEMWRSMRDRAQLWSLQGRALGLYTKEGESMIGYAIGAIGYYSDLFLYDGFGLVDRDVARVPPDQGVSTGHARVVTPEFFFPKQPTYYSATLVDRRTPAGAGLGVTNFTQSALSTQVRIERHALPPNSGFPPGVELRLYRFTLWD